MAKITNVRTFITCPDGINLVVVRVDTDQPGLYGIRLRNIYAALQGCCYSH